MDMSKHRKGFSLIEILISVVLVGLSIAALVAANSSFTMANGAGADLSTAEFLLEQIRELTALLPVAEEGETTITFGPEDDEDTLAQYDDIDDFDGFNSITLSGPIDANKNTLTDLASFSQSVTVVKVRQSNFNIVEADSSTSPFIRITVSVSRNGQEISSASWIRASY